MRLICALLALLPVLACGRSEDGHQPRRASDITLEPDTARVRDRVPANATLASLVSSAPLRSHLVPLIVEAAARVFDPRKLASGHDYEIVHTLDGLLRTFQYEIDLDSYLLVSAASDDRPEVLSASILAYEKTYEPAVASGVIDRDSPSLFEAMETAGERPELSMALSDVFGGDIDFNSDLQPGDRFAVAFEKVFREGEFVAYGPVAAAEFVNAGRRLRAIRFTPPGGKAAYYDEQGRSMRRFFLKSPLKFTPRVTSRFSRSRFHPILRIYRPHLGVDYQAPSGSPVVAVANGVVVSAGFSGQGGRTVVLRHGSGYETYYMHLSAIAKGVVRGARVSQGDVIGRVGMSGLATGPHLDYRIRRNGVFVNPLREHERLPPGDPISPVHMALFAEERDKALARLAAAAPSVPVPPAAPPGR
ncbi:MAG: M23 family metallopeptidase [Vicinamibacterales bacterium]